MLVLLIPGAEIFKGYEEQCKNGDAPDLEVYLRDKRLNSYVQEEWTQKALIALRDHKVHNDFASICNEFTRDGLSHHPAINDPPEGTHNIQAIRETSQRRLDKIWKA